MTDPIPIKGYEAFRVQVLPAGQGTLTPEQFAGVGEGADEWSILGMSATENGHTVILLGKAKQIRNIPKVGTYSV